MAITNNTLAMEALERLRRDIDKQFINCFTTTEAAPQKPLTQDDIRGWIKELGKRLPAPTMPQFIVKSAQEQMRTPVIGHYYARAEKRRTKTRRHRKCSRRKWKSMNRRQWDRIPIYAEPVDVLVFNGLTMVTERQYAAIKQMTIDVRRFPVE